MADPGKQSEFSPEELDRLEDALERWTGPDGSDGDEPVPEDSSLAPHLRARLEDYRGLLAMTRDELPMEDVPDALLASVLAEAHAGARTTTHASDRPVTRRELATAGPGLWERLRRSMLLPGFALAGSAALLLWVVQPSGDVNEGDVVLASAERRDAATTQTPARLAPDASPAPAAAEAPRLEERGVAQDSEAKGDAAAPGGGPALPAAPPAAAPTDDFGEDVLKDLADKSERKPKSKKSASMRTDPAESYPGLDDAPLAETGADKEALRDTLELADAARRKGRCGEAQSLYIEAMRTSGADSERARAQAGYGLCLATQGDERADKYFESARKLSPAIDGWIQRERGDGPARKSPAKPSAKSKHEMPAD